MNKFNLIKIALALYWIYAILSYFYFGYETSQKYTEGIVFDLISYHEKWEFLSLNAFLATLLFGFFCIISEIQKIRQAYREIESPPKVCQAYNKVNDREPKQGQ